MGVLHVQVWIVSQGQVTQVPTRSLRWADNVVRSNLVRGVSFAASGRPGEYVVEDAHGLAKFAIALLS